MTITRQQMLIGIQADWLIAELIKRQVTADAISQKLATLGYTDNAKTFLPMDIYLELFNWGEQQTGDMHLGVSIGQNLDARSFGVFGYIIQNATTVGELCHLVERYQAIFMRGMGFGFRQCEGQFEGQLEGQCEARWRYLIPIQKDVRQDVEFSLAVMVAFLRRQAGEDWFPTRVDFTHPCVMPDEIYRQHFGEHCYFEQPRNSVYFDASLMDMSLHEGDPYLLKLLLKQASGLLTDIEQKQDFLKTVRLLITAGLGVEGFNHESLAYQLNIAGRTLRRRLSQYNTSYQKLRDEIVTEVAQEALLESDASITAISQQLGYSESSAFVRSFKRQVGMSPMQYRSRAGTS